jgi:hypothetical protein
MKRDTHGRFASGDAPLETVDSPHNEGPQFRTIRLRIDTAETLKGLGKKGETYDDIIQRQLPKKYRRESVQA